MISFSLLVVAITAASALGIGMAPAAHADTACAWVDPYGVCVSNPTGNIPKVPDAPKLPRVPKLP